MFKSCLVTILMSSFLPLGAAHAINIKLPNCGGDICRSLEHFKNEMTGRAARERTKNARNQSRFQQRQNQIQQLQHHIEMNEMRKESNLFLRKSLVDQIYFLRSIKGDLEDSNAGIDTLSKAFAKIIPTSGNQLYVVRSIDDAIWYLRENPWAINDILYGMNERFRGLSVSAVDDLVAEIEGDDSYIDPENGAILVLEGAKELILKSGLYSMTYGKIKAKVTMTAQKIDRKIGSLEVTISNIDLENSRINQTLNGLYYRLNTY